MRTLAADDGDGAGDDDEAKTTVEARHWGEGLLGWGAEARAAARWGLGPRPTTGLSRRPPRPPSPARRKPTSPARTSAARSGPARPRDRARLDAYTRADGPARRRAGRHARGARGDRRGARPEDRARRGPAGTAARATPRPRATSPTAGTTRGPTATCCCRRSRPRRRAIGWVSRGALNHVSKRLAVPPAEAYGVASFYALLPTTPRPPIVAHVCDDIACRLLGAERICDDLERRARSGRARRPATGTRRGCAARASASASARRRSSSRPPARRQVPRPRQHPRRPTTSRACSRRFASHRP